MNGWRPVWSHPAEKDESDAGLTFTDILFGLVIAEFFTQFGAWPTSWSVRLHLLMATILVLGSWIGFRRSKNRHKYELKFFNLPLLRFVLDQAMVVLYFRISTLAKPRPDGAAMPDVDLMRTSLSLTATVFVLYLIWDGLGLWMVAGKDSKYKVSGKEADRVGFTITLVFLVLFTVLAWIGRTRFGAGFPECTFVSAVLLLIGYRWAKECRTSIAAT